MEVEAKQLLNGELNKMKAQFNQSERRNDEGNKQLAALREELAKVKKENEQLKLGGSCFVVPLKSLNPPNSI
jgi:DMPK coiled coil domain like.